MKYQLKSSTSLLALATATALGANAATAADMPVKSYAAPVVAESWTGPYIGGSIGGAWDNLGATNTCGSSCFGATSKANSADLSGSNFLVGVDAGFNYQMGSWVAGVEGDISGVPFHKARTGPDATGGFVEGSLSGLASLRGRIGYLFGQTLVYATGGWGWIGSNFQYQSKPGASLLFSTTQSAPVVGGGFDYKVNRYMTVGIEGLAFLNNRSAATFSNSTGRTYNFSNGNIGVVRAKANFTW
jgi:outer membrane immunogenic protein